jgi:predicted unusual protein kinase regulating ubiquinone biosynthesis (AarF/ABC1/UbiB family)
MGGLMIKVGQFLSARLDVLPPEITDELSGLQDEVPPETFEDIRAKAESELALPLAEHYASFDETPLAAASLGQVHRACLRETDAAEMGFAEVVVKVQRPHIEQIVEVDLAAIRRVGGWLQRYKPIRERADVEALINEFAATTLAEIDYLAEASNAEAFAEAFEGDEGIRVPKVVWELTTRRVLTLEDGSAIKLGDYDAITAAGISRAEVARRLFDTYLQQIFEDGFFHADPHPGNLFVTPLDGVDATGARNWKLTFIDFGMVGRVPENLRSGLREMLLAIVTQDGSRLIRSFKTLNVLLPSADVKAIELASMQLFERFGNMSVSELGKLDPAEMVGFGLQFQELLRDMPFQLPENLLLLGRAVAILSGMCSGLEPEFNLWTAIAPFASKLLGDEETSSFQTVLDEATKVFQIVIGLPGRADRVLTQMERGEFMVQTPRLDIRVRRLERAMQRQTGGVVFAAFLVSGAVVRASDRVMSNWLMAGAGITLLWLVFGRKGRHSGQ